MLELPSLSMAVVIPFAAYTTPPVLYFPELILLNSEECLLEACLLITNSPGVSIAGTVSVPFGAKFTPSELLPPRLL